ncbi:MAG TPA: GGDEF domain-containing protein [Candidatus Choladousia intestinipullorum]|nr:GGDEF domain-containing protein [Candidatus Choladousia intestinipullorum]
MKCFILVLLLSSLYVTNYILYHIVLDCIRMNDLEYTSSHDMLTGLGNRAGLLKHMQSLIRTDQVFSVLFMDLDRFKMVNDQYGHVVGDQYLIHFSKICSRILQNNGKVFRFGGDEFVGLYYGIVPAGTVKQLEECREWDEGAPCPFNQVSVGVLPCRPPHKNIDEILQQADAVMYKAKWSKPGEK